MTGRVRRWSPSTVLAAAAIAVGVVVAGDGYPLAASVCAGVLAAAAWWVSPLRGTGSARHDDAGTGSGGVVVYWRPGCPYSERLRSSLRRHPEVTWVNIWDDPAAAAFVRRHNDGNEVVPTVVMDSGVWTNPEPKDVRKAARRAAR